MDVLSRFRRAVLAALGVDDAPDLPVYDRMALYPCEVVKCATDGSTVDVKPDADRVKPHSAVKVKTPAGITAVVQPGARVLLGWEGGDPSKPYVSLWDSATVTKLVIKATNVYLGDEAGAEPLVKRSEFNGHTHTVPASGLAAPAGGGLVTGSATAAAPTAITGTTNVAGK